MATDFTLPELGENITAGDVLRVLVKPGDTLARDQPVLELETDKATVEVPSSVSGRVSDVKVKAGDKVKVGQVILSVEAGGAAASAPAAKAEPAGAPKPEPAVRGDARAKVPAEPGLERHVEAMRAGGSDKAGVAEQEEAQQPSEAYRPRGAAPAGRAADAGRADRADNVVDISRGARAAAEPAAPEGPVAPAAPSVRRMARELGIDIAQVPGTGPGGRISIEDVKAYAKRVISGGGAKAAAAVTTPAAPPLPDFSRWGQIERQPMRAVRRKTAEHLAAAWATVPHVTQHDRADITALEELRKTHAKQVEAAGGNLTVTAIALKVVGAALKKFPQFNASIDLAADEIIYKKYVHVGVAVDTDRGLLVPVIRDVDTKNIVQLAAELAQASQKARDRKLALEDMQGGCFSISNLGGIGGTSFTPIVNAPEVAILGISRARIEPVWTRLRPARAAAPASASERGWGPASSDDAAFEPRLMLPLSLSYDHRVIDGADGARFLRWVCAALEEPFLLALNG